MLSTEEISRMSVEERLEAIDDLRHSLSGKDEAALPPWHESVLKQSVEKIRQGKARFVTHAEVEKRLFADQC